MMSELNNQYNRALRMLAHSIESYDESLWQSPDYQSPAWQVAYHAVFYTNIYCSASEEGILHRPKEREKYHRLIELDARKLNSYSRANMLLFVAFVHERVPGYLAKMEPDSACWPDWYECNQFEFQLNNLRHLQHHVGELTERQNNVRSIGYEWS